MKRHYYILIAIWLITVVAAFYIGSNREAMTSPRIEETKSRNNQQREHLSHQPNSHNENKTPVEKTPPQTKRSRLIASSALSITEINTLTNPLERSRLLLEHIDRLSPNEFLAALTEFKAMSTAGQRPNEYSMLLHAWGKVAPLSALQYTQETIQDTNATQEILSSWATIDTNAALEWARASHTGEDANPLLHGIIKGIVNTNPDLATSILHEFPYSRERGDALNTIIPHIAAQGTEHANKWLSSITDQRLLSGATKFLAKSLAEQDPQSSAEWAISLADDTNRQSAIKEVAETWTNDNPTETMAWLDGLQAADKHVAEPPFIESYAKQEPDAAADWLDARADSEHYQTLLHSFAQGTTRTNPLLALNYGNELEDDSNRSRTVRRALWSLFRTDQESARDWIKNNEVPESLKRQTDRMLRVE